MNQNDAGKPPLGRPLGRHATSASAPDQVQQGSGSTSLGAFLKQTAERDNPGEVFELESSRMLEAHVNGRIWSKLGAMVAHMGDLSFKREGLLEGGIGKALMRAVSQEMTPLTAIEGSGVVYLADAGKQVTILRLEGDALNVNGNDLLAFEDSVQYDITMHRRVAGWVSGGLFSIRVQGRGLVAIVSHGTPLTLPVRPGQPVVTDPNATVAWSQHLQPDVRVDTSFRSLMGRGGGETIRMVFSGEGFVVVQPYEEHPALLSSS